MDNKESLPYAPNSLTSPTLDSAKEEAQKAANLAAEKKAKDAALAARSYYHGAPEDIINSRDLKKRAKWLALNGNIIFRECNYRDDMAIPVTNSDLNRTTIMDALFDRGSGSVPYPYYDTFSGMVVDEDGIPITEYHSHSALIVECALILGLKKQSFESMEKIYQRWAAEHKRNRLIDRFTSRMPEWDATPRLRNYLIKLFNLKDSPENRAISEYFWLSLFYRITMPGCIAPIVISLIGAQNAGKSYFGTLICREILGDENVDATPLSLNDIERKLNDWLRKITGKSIIASIGEMRGYRKADIETVKDFITQVSDSLHYKFHQNIQPNRQWVIIMSSNSYDGFYRDETGNRRFYPLFVSQTDDIGGQPAWAEHFSADFSTFRDDLWQIMAECRAFHEANGYGGYVDLVNKCSRVVSDVSAKEMRFGRGVIKDEFTEAFLTRALLGANMEEINYRRQDCIIITNTEIATLWQELRQSGKPNFSSIKRVLEAWGWEQSIIKGKGRCYVLHGCSTVFEAKKYCYYRGWEFIEEDVPFTGKLAEWKRIMSMQCGEDFKVDDQEVNEAINAAGSGSGNGF